MVRLRLLSDSSSFSIHFLPDIIYIVIYNRVSNTLYDMRTWS